MYWHGGAMGGWGFAWMLFNALVLWALLAAGGLLLWRALRGPEPAGDPPERLLAQRFARGEIDDDEYRRRLDVIRRA
jgi:putative membrane protein